MTKESAIAFLALLFVILLLILSIDHTQLTDKNEFLNNFVGVEMLGFLGVILTLGIGMSAQLIVSVKRMRDRLSEEALSGLVAEIRDTAKKLVLAYFTALMLMLFKSLTEDYSLTQAVTNSAAILIIVFFFLALSDIVLSLFDVEEHL